MKKLFLTGVTIQYFLIAGLYKVDDCSNHPGGLMKIKKRLGEMLVEAGLLSGEAEKSFSRTKEGRTEARPVFGAFGNRQRAGNRPAQPAVGHSKISS